jgi:DNA-binding transcriptional LysR family regulator
MSSWLVADAVAAGQLVPLFGPETHPQTLPQPAIHALRLPGRSHPVKAQLFINHLRDYIGKPAYWAEVFTK